VIKYPATMQEIHRRMMAMNKLFFDLRRDGMTYVEIGQLMECSSSWARQRVLRYEELMSEGVAHE
jgi:hypothetical protein